MAKKRIGVIGIGEIGTTKHLTQLVKHSDEVEVVALCDILTERCEKANKDFGLKAKIYTDYKEMCAADDVDAVHVCTPNPLHCEMRNPLHVPTRMRRKCLRHRKKQAESSQAVHSGVIIRLRWK